LRKLIGHEESIIWYTTDDPSDYLLAVARDQSKEVLICKVAVVLVFDEPHAFKQRSLRGTKNNDFNLQVVGRILRIPSPYIQLSATVTALPLKPMLFI